jgi:hypothetical protein
MAAGWRRVAVHVLDLLSFSVILNQSGVRLVQVVRDVKFVCWRTPGTVRGTCVTNRLIAETELCEG